MHKNHMKQDRGLNVTQCSGCISANTRPHQLIMSWGDGEMQTVVLCNKGIRELGLFVHV